MVVLRSEAEAAGTRKKLAWLEQQLGEFERTPGGNEPAREATLRSFYRLIKQLKEELIRYEIDRKRTAAKDEKKTQLSPSGTPSGA
ncbi:MAG: hypothetical protein HY000_34420 [Planctomycetes bacterium]|nr:hypothetical protein [Planctomycetota bacterium]